MQPRILWITAVPPNGASTVPGTATPAEPVHPGAAWKRLPAAECAALVVDCPVEGSDSDTYLEQLRRALPATPIFVHQPGATAAEAARLACAGACLFLDQGPAAARQLAEAMAGAHASGLAGLAVAVLQEDWERMLVGESRELRQVAQIIRMVGPRRATVLITGETGTGKEIVARALHLAGPRRRGPFVALNCSALPDTLLEAELFGHVRGAFTGALQSRVGRFEQAQGGTVFLDEVGDLPLDLQAKLLRVLQEREVQRLGGSEAIRLDVRVIAATNCDLEAKIAQGRFRADLYYRLNVVPIELPPLRRRPADIPPLVHHFIDKVCRAEDLARRSLLPGVLERLTAYSWPGNVRQLENAVEMAISLCGDRNLLAASDFPLPVPPAHLDPGPPVIDLPATGLDFAGTVQEIERSILEQALRRTGGNKKAAAEMLGLKRTTLAAKVRSLSEAPCN